ncbi:hypothetical protein [Phenylobacterium sp. J367]|uniref:hypothetical protein n=1 Tax=Phenylobacterium sp. J367 TaxID=2898435 RepID=UPI002151DA2B|nr:hypothetical protein [Phenylobacterium sp. J367]MCR5878006.1 hypothetical protein [Phenylobacterium sp. J367]
MTPAASARPSGRDLRRLMTRLGAVDATDALATAMVLAELRERLEEMAGRLGEAFGALVALETLISAAEGADVLDRTGLLCLLQLDLADFMAEFLAPEGLAA